MSARIDILLATYNGERFLRAQLDSLSAQSFQDFRILARDDGSQDGTMEILREYQARFPDKILLVEGGENLGVAGNFSRLMEAFDAPYLMLCDQDDVWHADKIEKSMAAMKLLEASCIVELPLLVHSDAEMVDEEGKKLRASFSVAHGFRPARKMGRDARLLLQNDALGCTFLFNRALAQAALPIPPQARMHDHWLILLAAHRGKISYLPQATLAYRQHARNVIGMRKKRSFSQALEKARSVLEESAAQAEALLARLENQLSGKQRYYLERFIALPRTNRLVRAIWMLDRGHLRRPWWHTLPFWLYASRGKPASHQ